MELRKAVFGIISPVAGFHSNLGLFAIQAKTSSKAAARPQTTERVSIFLI